MWTNICQGVLLVSTLLRFCFAVQTSLNGRSKIEPLGAAGVVFNLVWLGLALVVVWKAGALSTIVGAP